MIHPRTRQIQLAEQIADEVGLLVETDSIAYAVQQVRRLAQLHYQRMAAIQAAKKEEG